MATFLETFSPSQSSGLDIESLISAPLVAASKANVMMLSGQTRFILENCFTKKAGNQNEPDIYEPNMINMSIHKPVIDSTKKPDEPGYITIVPMTFSIPLLSIISLNSLAIDKINVDFDMEITSVTSRKNTNNGNIIDTKAQLNGKICSKRICDNKNGENPSNDQTSSRLMVNIHAGPLPLPTGVLAIIDLYSKSIMPIPDTKPATTTNLTPEKPTSPGKDK